MNSLNYSRIYSKTCCKFLRIMLLDKSGTEEYKHFNQMESDARLT